MNMINSSIKRIKNTLKNEKKFIDKNQPLKNFSFGLFVDDFYKNLTVLTEEFNKVKLSSKLFENDEERIELFQIFSKKQKEKTFEEKIKCFHYLRRTTLFQSLSSYFADDITQMKVLYFCANFLKVKVCERNEVLFNINDDPDNFYIIFSGEIEILKPYPVKKEMIAFDFYKHLYKYKNENNMYFFNLTLNENKERFPINKVDIDDLPNIILAEIMTFGENLFFDNFRTNIKNLGLDLKDYGFNEENINDPEYFDINKKYIKEKLSYPKQTLKKYNFLIDYYTKRNFYIFENKPFLTLQEGIHFGDSALDTRSKRNATIRASKKSVFLYLHKDYYMKCFGSEKQASFLRETKFLQTNFFFSNL